MHCSLCISICCEIEFCFSTLTWWNKGISGFANLILTPISDWSWSERLSFFSFWDDCYLPCFVFTYLSLPLIHYTLHLQKAAQMVLYNPCWRLRGCSVLSRGQKSFLKDRSNVFHKVNIVSNLAYLEWKAFALISIYKPLKQNIYNGHHSVGNKSNSREKQVPITLVSMWWEAYCVLPILGLEKVSINISFISDEILCGANEHYMLLKPDIFFIQNKVIKEKYFLFFLMAWVQSDISKWERQVLVWQVLTSILRSHCKQYMLFTCSLCVFQSLVFLPYHFQQLLIWSISICCGMFINI